MQQVVWVTEQPLRLNHLRDIGHRILKGGYGMAIAFSHGDENQCGKVKPQAGGFKLGAIAPDHP
ncbi:hypothetical protein D3C81_1970770 [compost metagenome]